MKYLEPVNRTKKILFGLMSIFLFLPQLILAGNLNPTAPPGPTMKSLDEIPPTWSQRLDSTNGSTFFGREGCGSSRFECIMFEGNPIQLPQAVLDKETGLVWAKNATGDGTTKSWQGAIDYCVNLTLGGRKGWRLSTREELGSLIDPSVTGSDEPKLPPGHPFVNADYNKVWWASTTYESNSGMAWRVGVGADFFNQSLKTDFGYVWCVRGGNGSATGNW